MQVSGVWTAEILHAFAVLQLKTNERIGNPAVSAEVSYTTWSTSTALRLVLSGKSKIETRSLLSVSLPACVTAIPQMSSKPHLPSRCVGAVET